MDYSAQNLNNNSSTPPKQNEDVLSQLISTIYGGKSQQNIKAKSIIEQLYLDRHIDEKKYYNALDFLSTNSGTNELKYIKQNSLVSENVLAEATGKFYGIPYIDLNKADLNSQTLHIIPIELARAQLAVCVDASTDIETKKRTLKVALADPLDIQKITFLESQTNSKILPYISAEEQILDIIDNRYDSDILIKKDFSDALKDVGDQVFQLDENLLIDDLSKDLSSAPVARIVSMILEYGIKFKSSDAHIEPHTDRLSVRFRINGILEEKIADIPIKLLNSVVSRIKILSNLKIDEHRIPQDGRFEVSFGKTRMDIRVSVMPTVYGEKVVMRFLDKTSGLFPLESTGMRAKALKDYQDALKQTQGIILVTGPTGSGKTVTLSSSLGVLNKKSVNIVTLEDPVEIRVDGVNQVQVNSDVGLSFANGLRAFLRQDPDIIMIGEIRDEETAQLAIQAALVGRLVLATLHTNSAAGAITRLLNMNIEPFLLSSVMNLLVAQRLPRKICNNCKYEYMANEVDLKFLHEKLDGINGYEKWNVGSPRAPEGQPDINKAQVKLYKGKGCEKCNDSGYSGRIGIFEVLRVDQEIAKMIMQHKTAQEIEEVAKQKGMITMLQDGLLKALDGITTIEEVLRVQY